MIVTNRNWGLFAGLRVFFEPVGQLMHMELDRLNREVDVKFTRQDALDMKKVLRETTMRVLKQWHV